MVLSRGKQKGVLTTDWATPFFSQLSVTPDF